MMNPQLLDFIKQQTDKGASKEEIKKMLLVNGWTSQDVEEGFSVVSSQDSQVTSQPNPSVAAIKMDEKNYKLPRVFQLLKESWRIYRKKFLILTGIMVVPVILSFLGNIALSQKETSNSFFIIGVIVSLVSFFLLLLVMPVLIFSVKEEIGVKESYKKGLKMFLSYLWICVLMTLIIVGGFFLFIIPGFLFSIWFSLAIFVLIFEEKQGFSTLFKSKYRAKGDF